MRFAPNLAPEYAAPADHSWGILWDAKHAGRLSVIDGVMVAAVSWNGAPYRLLDPGGLHESEGGDDLDRRHDPDVVCRPGQAGALL